MIGDRNILKPQLLGSQGHLLNRVLAITPVGLYLKIAFEVLIAYELRESMLSRRFYLTAILSKLWFDILEPELLINLLFCGPRDAPLPFK